MSHIFEPRCQSKLRSSRRTFLGTAAAFGALTATSGCSTSASTQTNAAGSADAGVDALVAEAGAALRPPRQGGLPYCGEVVPLRLPGLSEDYVQANASRVRTWIARADALTRQNLSADARETLAALRWDLTQDINNARFYWNQFPLNPNTSTLKVAEQILGSAPVASAEDADLYRELARATATFIDELTDKVRGQLARGAINNREQLAVVIQLLRAKREGVSDFIGLAPERTASLDPAAAERLRVDLNQIAERDVGPAFDRLIHFLEADYAPHATENVRYDRAPNGAEYYAWLVELSSERADPSVVHETAIADIARLDHELAEMRTHLGDTGADDADSFHQRLGRDRRWIARDAAQIERWFNAAIRKIEPHIPEYFRDLPAIPYSVEAIAPEYRAAVVNGTFIQANPENRHGTYYYNPSDLETTSWLWGSPLIYHELLPGHHLQSISQTFSTSLSPYRKDFYHAGYLEGWGEYARHLAEGMGVYDDDRWGLYASRLLDRRFAIAVALDTGMQVRGWSVDQAEAFLAKDPLTKAAKRRRNVFTFACDRSGVSTAYWRGGQVLDELLRDARQHQGATFNIRDFHYVLLNGGCLPFALLRTRMRRTGFVA